MIVLSPAAILRDGSLKDRLVVLWCPASSNQAGYCASCFSAPVAFVSLRLALFDQVVCRQVVNCNAPWCDFVLEGA
jgi:hypothetical protein